MPESVGDDSYTSILITGKKVEFLTSNVILLFIKHTPFITIPCSSHSKCQQLSSFLIFELLIYFLFWIKFLRDIYIHLIQFITSNNYLFSIYSGFRSKHSTTVLLNIIDGIVQAVDEGNSWYHWILAKPLIQLAMNSCMGNFNIINSLIAWWVLCVSICLIEYR